MILSVETILYPISTLKYGPDRQYRKTDCLVVGEMYRIDRSRSESDFLFLGDDRLVLLKRPSIQNVRRDAIGYVHNKQVIQYLGESVFEEVDATNYYRLPGDQWYYKVFADDQVGWIRGELCRLVYLKTEQGFSNS